MDLKEIEEPSEMMVLAIEDGISNTVEYGLWLIGYTSGMKTARESIANIEKIYKELEDYEDIIQ